MRENLRVTMLLSDAFGGFGGISQFNRDFLTALDASREVERIHVLPRVIAEPAQGYLPETIVFDRSAAGSKFAFLTRFFARMLHDDGTNLVICGHINLLSMAQLLARLRRGRLILIIHGIEAWAPAPGWAARKFAHRIDGFIAVSRHSAERFSAWSGVPMNKAHILPNCVDLERFQPGPRDPGLVQRYGLEGKKVLLTLGRLASQERYKGFDEVIEALPGLLKRYPDLVYLVAGDGPDRERLVRKAEQLGLKDKVIFAGRILEQEKVAHYNLSDLYVMPSAGEGFGIVLIEAAACGTAVIGSRADGSREALLDGALGQLVDPKDSAALVAAICHALDNPAPRARLAEVNTFSVQNFQARVAAWACQQQQAIAVADEARSPSLIREATAG